MKAISAAAPTPGPARGSTTRKAAVQECEPAPGLVHDRPADRPGQVGLVTGHPFLEADQRLMPSVRESPAGFGGGVDSRLLTSLSMNGEIGQLGDEPLTEVVFLHHQGGRLAAGPA